MPIIGVEQEGGTVEPAQAAQAAQAAQSAKGFQDGLKAGQSGTTVPPVEPVSPDIPPGAIEMTGMFFTMVVILVLGFPIMRALIRRFDKKSEQLKAGPQLHLEPQLRQLQDSIDGLTLEVERIAEGQRFMAKVIGDREKVPASLPSQQS